MQLYLIRLCFKHLVKEIHLYWFGRSEKPDSQLLVEKDNLQELSTSILQTQEIDFCQRPVDLDEAPKTQKRSYPQPTLCDCSLMRFWEDDPATDSWLTGPIRSYICIVLRPKVHDTLLLSNGKLIELPAGMVLVILKKIYSVLKHG